jgi:excisionase family DNA binding protein
MRLHAGQLSLFATDDQPQDETIERPKRSKRQRATQDGEPVESAPSERRRAAAKGRAPSTAAADKAVLLTTNEAADLLHVHPRTVQRLVERGQLCAVRLGSAVRFDPDDVAGLIDRVKRGPTPSDPAPARGPSLLAIGPALSFRDRIGSGG